MAKAEDFAVDDSVEALFAETGVGDVSRAATDGQGRAGWRGLASGGDCLPFAKGRS